MSSINDTGLEIDPVDVALDMLRKELPAFQSVFSKSTMSVRVRGALPIKSEVDTQVFYFAIPVITGYGDWSLAEKEREKETPVDREIRLARERHYVEHRVRPIIDHLVESIRELGIDALNLEGYIKDRERVAAEAAAHEAHEIGLEKGKRAGRRELLRELLEAADMDLDHFRGADDE